MLLSFVVNPRKVQDLGPKPWKLEVSGADPKALGRMRGFKLGKERARANLQVLTQIPCSFLATSAKLSILCGPFRGFLDSVQGAPHKGITLER